VTRQTFAMLVMVCVFALLLGAAMDAITASAQQAAMGNVFVPDVTLDPSQVLDLRP